MVQDVDPRGIITLENLDVVSVPYNKKSGRRYIFTLQSRGDVILKACKVLDGNLVSDSQRSYILSSETENDRDDWIKAINESMENILAR